MGIIAGFIGGAGKAMSRAGEIMFADKIAKERDEANFLRDGELKKGMATEEREFKSSEAAKRDAAALERTKYTADTKAKSTGAGKPTREIKNVNFLMSKEGGGKKINEAITIAFPGSKIKHTDDEGNQIVVVPAEGGGMEEVGRIIKDKKGKQRWLGAGEETEFADVTSKHRKKAKKEASEKAGLFRTDVSDFPETEGDRKEWTKKRAQQLAQQERAAKKSGGIVGGAMDKTKKDITDKDLLNMADETKLGKGADISNKAKAPQKALDAVKADPKLLTQFIEKYGYDPTKQ